MTILHHRRRIVLFLFLAQLWLLLPPISQGQTETFDIIRFTPPKDWKKTAVQGSITYTTANKEAGKFCVLTIYSSTDSVGTPPEDFSNEWNALVMKQYKADPNPKTETLKTPEGWQITAGGTGVEQDGIKFLVLLTVFTGFGKKVSVVANTNDQSYFAGIDNMLQNIKFEKPAANSSPASSGQNNQPAAGAKDTANDVAIQWYVLLREYQNNEIAADGKYTGKRIRVTGKFEHAAMEHGKIIVWFNTPALTYSNFGCYFPDSQRAAVAELKSGQTIVVEGICRGQLTPGRLMMEDCVLK